MQLKSTAVELPAEEAVFPDGPGAELTAANCSACHSASMVLVQPRLGAAKWREAVEKMRSVYKAPVEDADVAPIVAYLTALEDRRE